MLSIPSMITIFLAIAAIAVVISAFTRFRFEEGIPVSMCALTLLMYLGSMAFSPQSAFIITAALCAACYVAAGVFLYINRKKGLWQATKSRLFTPGFLIFAVIFCFLYLSLHMRDVLEWDELRLWGASPRYMYYHNEFFSKPSASCIPAMKGYPPGMACLQYLFLKLNLVFESGAMHVALSVFCLSLLMPITKRLTWKRKYLIPLFTVGLLILPFTFANLPYFGFYVTLFIDPVLGFVFGYAVATLATSTVKSPFVILRSALALCLLSIFKDTGIFLMFIGMLILVVNVLFFNGYGIALKDSFKKANRKRILLMLGLCVLAVLLPIFVRSTWRDFAQANGLSNYFITDLNATNVMRIISEQVTDVEREIYGGFRSALLRRSLITSSSATNPPASYLGIMGAFFVFGVAMLFCMHKKKRWQFGVNTVLIFAGSAIYTVGLLMLYLLGFSESEGLNLSSYERYMNVYMIAIEVYFVYYAASMLGETENAPNLLKRAKYVGCCFLAYLLLLTPAFMNTGVSAFIPPSESLSRRAELRSYSSFLRDTLGEEAVSGDEKTNVFFVNEDVSRQIEHHYIYYDLLDSIIFIKNPWQQMYIASEPDAGQEERDADFAAFVSLLQGGNKFAYVYLHAGIDDAFKQQFAPLFESEDAIREFSLYRVDYSGAIPRLTYYAEYLG